MSLTSSLQDLVNQQAVASGVNPALATAVALQESGGNPSAIGQAGEVGLFQLMPGTASDLGVDPFDVTQNVQGGITYLQQMLQRYGGNTAMALAAYNAGPGTVDAALKTANWFSRLPASTQAYVTSILSGVAPGPGTASTGPDLSSLSPIEIAVLAVAALVAVWVAVS